MLQLLAKCFPKIDATSIERLKIKFDVCYLLAKVNMAFVNYPAILELEERHGVDVIFAYRTKDSAKVFHPSAGICRAVLI